MKDKEYKYLEEWEKLAKTIAEGWLKIANNVANSKKLSYTKKMKILKIINKMFE